MAFQLPPWLSAAPGAVQQARQAGANVGINMAQNQLRATQVALEAGRAMAEMAMRSQEAAARRAQEDQQMALRQWETEQNLAARVAAQQSEAAQQAAALEETGRWHTLQSATDEAKLAAQTQHWRDLAAEKAQGEIRSLPNGELVRVRPDGTWEQIKPANPAGGTVTPTAVFSALSNPMAAFGGMLDRQFWPGAAEQFRAYIKPSFTGLATNAPAAKVTAPGDIAKLRQEANAAINAGKDPAAVRDLFFNTTGERL